MKHWKQLFALLLTGVLLTTATGCEGFIVEESIVTAKTEAPTTSTTSQPPTTVLKDPEVIPSDGRFLENIPDNLNFAAMGYPEDARTVRVAYVEGLHSEYVRRSLKADALDEGDVDIVTMARDNRLEDQLGLIVSVDQVASSVAGLENAIAPILAAGGADYDILVGSQFFSVGMATRGYMYDLQKLNQVDADYLDLYANYWNRNYNSKLAYKGAQYWITGDIALDFIGGAYCTFVNTAMYQSVQMDMYGSIYDIVREGKWTLDLLSEMAARCYIDDGYISGEEDEGDTYGFGYEPNNMIDGLVMGSNVPFTTVDPSTGEVLLVFGDPQTNCYDFANKLKSLAIQPASYQYPNTDNERIMQAFADGKVAFTVNKLYYAELYLSEMREFDVIPVPKFDKDQESYGTGISELSSIYGIAYCSEKIPQAAAALEFLCAYSSQDVKLVYLDTMLRGRYTRNNEIKEMVDLIQYSISTDFAVIWSAELSNISQIFRACNGLNENNVKRKKIDWEENLKNITQALDRYLIT